MPDGAFLSYQILELLLAVLTLLLALLLWQYHKVGIENSILHLLLREKVITENARKVNECSTEGR